MSKYKIGLIGAQGTGKTTAAYELAAELKRRGKDVYVLSEVARSCPLPLNDAATIESQFWIMGKQLTREQSAISEILVSDRTLMDSLIYGYRKYPDMFRSLKPFVKRYMETYAAVIYFSPNDDYLMEDGTRSVDKQFRDEIDALMVAMIEEFDVETKSIEQVLSMYGGK